MTGKVDGGGPSDAGVITNSPNNRAYILDPVTETFVEDPEGQRVYGRITFSAGTWTLAFFTNEAGVETAYSLPSQDIRVFFLEVFTLSSVPTIPSSPAMFGTLDVTADVVDASATLRGVVNTIAQSFAGLKTFLGGIVNQGILAGSIQTDATSTGTDQTVTPPTKMILRVTNSGLDSIGGFTTSSTVQFFYLINDTGGDLVLKNEFASANTDIVTGSNSDLTLSDGAAVLVMRNTSTSRWLCVGGGGGSPFVLQAVGSSPNANGATYNSTTGDFSLQPADGTNPGVLTAGAQTIGGAKTFSGNISAANLSGTNSGDVTIAAFGSTPDAKGASLSGQAITLQPANNTNPGLISLLAQTMGAGDKTFADSLIAGARVRGATATDSSTTGATATIAAPAALILRVTNAALTGISKFSGPTNGQTFVLVNLTGAPLTIVNANAATDDIVTGTGANLTMLNQAAVILFYDTTSTRWRIAGGSGSGGGTQSVETISTSTSLTSSPTATNRWINVDATGGNIVITLPAASADTIGTNYFFKRSDSVESNTVTIQRAGADTIDEGNTQTLPFQFSRMGITGLSATTWGVK